MSFKAELDLVKLNVFLIAAFVTGVLFKKLKTSAMLGHMLVGALLGPGLANFVPHVHGVELAGMLGIQLEVVESGLATNLSTLKRLAPRALLIGVLGIILPLGGAVGVVCVLAVIEGTFSAAETLKVAFAVGAALAPTSLGVTAALLSEQNELDTELGQLISLSALFDDVLSLMLLAEVKAAAKKVITAWGMIQPIVFSLVFVVGAGIAAYFLPKGLNILVPRVPLADNKKWKLGLFLICSTAILASYAAYSAGTSFLLAAYLTGVAFADAGEENFLSPWIQHVRVHIHWLVLIFFAATIGFAIPLKSLFDPAALGPGAVLAVVAVLGKLVSGFGAKTKTDVLAIGFGMLARGEFGFLIAANANKGGILSERMYAATIWGVLIPTVITPLFFGPIFRWRATKMGLHDEGEDLDKDEPLNEGRVSELRRVRVSVEETRAEFRRSLDARRESIYETRSVGSKSLDAVRESIYETRSTGRKSLDSNGNGPQV